MICAYCGSEYSLAEIGMTCPTCGKAPSHARLFLLAELGEADAMYALAMGAVSDDTQLVRYYLHRSAEAGCRAAAITYAQRLLAGAFGDPDPAAAKAVVAPFVRQSPRAALISARAGLFLRGVAPSAPEIPALYPVALRFASDAELARDFETACAIIRLFADRREGMAAELLGSLYEEGRMLNGDLRMAKRWYLAAWEMGNPSALVRLGDLLLSGRLGEEPDYETATECYLSAESAGNDEAAIRLADAALEGVGRQESVRDALLHYRKAQEKSAYARERIDEIMRALDVSYRRAILLQTSGEYVRAAVLLTDLVEAGHAEAANRLAYLKQNGLGTLRDRRAAAALYALAAERGSRIGLYNLGVCYAEGIGIAFSYRKAVELLERADAAGVSSANAVLLRLRARRRRAELRRIYSLACLLYRRGDFVASARLLAAAAEEGDAASMHRLACHLRRGDGVRVDPRAAELLEGRAREAGCRDMRRCEIGYLRIRREHELAGRLKP